MPRLPWDRARSIQSPTENAIPVEDKSLEPRKVIVSQSSVKAAKRCLFHLVPISTSTTILVLNIRSLYIGVNFKDAINSDTITLELLQLAAKANEILIVASLGLIVMEFVRHELLFGDGLPLGLIGSGLSFSRFDFFFTKEFYGSLKYRVTHGRVARKMRFIAVLIIAGLIALLAGPASAVLIIPKTQSYPAGGAHFFLNGSTDQLWPADLSGDMSDLRQFCNTNNSETLAVCPAGGFFSLLNRWSHANYTNFIYNSTPTFAKDLSGARFYWPNYSPQSQIPPLYSLGNPREDAGMPQRDTWLVQPHAATVTILDQISADWWPAIVSSLGIDPVRIDDRNIKTSALSAISSVRCAEPRDLSATDKTTRFPVMDGRFTWAQDQDLVVDTLNETSVDHLRFQWVHLPDDFGAVSIGGLFEAPWEVNNASRVVVGCSAQLGYVPTDVFSDSYSFWSGWYPYNIQFGGRIPPWTAQGSSATNGRIALGDDWLDLLTPSAPDLGEVSRSNVSTIELILENSGLLEDTQSLDLSTLTEEWIKKDQMSSAGRTRFLEAIICSVLTDGLSRSTSYRSFNTSGPVSDWPIAPYNPLPQFGRRILKSRKAFETPDIPLSNLTTLYARMQVSGYALRLTLPGYLSVGVLVSHMIMAFIHILWVAWRRRTSESWVSIAELIALAQNSRPAFHELPNTTGGVHRSRTFSRVAKIRAVPQPRDPEHDHVELIFKESTREEDQNLLEDQQNTAIFSPSPIRQRRKASQGSLRSWTFPYAARETESLSDVQSNNKSGRQIVEIRLTEDEDTNIIRVGHAYR